MSMTYDGSSYPKPTEGKSVLDQIQQMQAIEQQNVNIDRSKLELAIKNQDNLLATLNALPKDAGPEEMRKWGQSAVKAKLVNPRMYAEFVTNMPAPTGDPVKDREALTRYRQTVEQRAMGISEAMKWRYGQETTVDNNQQIQPSMRNMRSGAITPAGAPIQRQLPVEAPVVGPQGQQSLGPQAPVVPEGMEAVPGGLAGQFRPKKLPVGPVTDPRIQGPSSNFGGNVTGATVENLPPAGPALKQVAENKYNPVGPMTSQTPMFDEGKRMLAADQQEASQRAMRVKPAAQALQLMQQPGMLSGPLSEQFTQGAAALKTFGLIPSDMNDPTAIRQEVAKKLAQYVSGNPVGQRSDSAQILAEASSPNPKTQTLPALIKLTKDAIVLDRVQAAMPNSFKDKDLSTYGKFKAAFPSSIDERAFGLDMEKDQGKTLVDKMAARLKNNSKDREATKFFNSLRIAKEQGFYGE
jgi:hypothetical protein